MKTLMILSVVLFIAESKVIVNHREYERPFSLEQQFHARTGALDSQIRDLKAVVEGFKSQLSSHTAMIKELTEENMKLKADNMDIKSSIVGLKGIINDASPYPSNGSRKARIEEFVSFTAYLTEPRDCFAGVPVIFDGMITNYGDSYDSTSGVFTCPHTGYYLIMVNILAEENPSQSFMNGLLQIDGSTVLGAYARDYNTFGHASNSAVVLCTAGQSVTVTCPANGFRINGDNERHSTFTATLLNVV